MGPEYIGIGSPQSLVRGDRVRRYIDDRNGIQCKVKISLQKILTILCPPVAPFLAGAEIFILDGSNKIHHLISDYLLLNRMHPRVGKHPHTGMRPRVGPEYIRIGSAQSSANRIRRKRYNTIQYI